LRLIDRKLLLTFIILPFIIKSSKCRLALASADEKGDTYENQSLASRFVLLAGCNDDVYWYHRLQG
jgi:hypothetical protein